MLPVAVNVPIGGGGFVAGGGGGGGGGGGPPFLSPAARGAVVARRRLSTAGMMHRCVLVFIATSFQRFLLLPFQVHLVGPLRTSGANSCDAQKSIWFPKERK